MKSGSMQSSISLRHSPIHLKPIGPMPSEYINLRSASRIARRSGLKAVKALRSLVILLVAPESTSHPSAEGDREERNDVATPADS